MAEDRRDRKERLSAARRALLEERLKGRRRAIEPPVAPAAAAGPVPATPMQRLLWAFAQSHPDNPAYHIHAAVRLSGTLDAEALRVALVRVVERHAALRTVFVLRDRALIQEVRPSCDVPLLQEPSAPGRSIARATAELCRPFDLAAGPLLRALLLRESPAQHLLLLVVHHIVADEWSLKVLWRELSAFYDGAGEPAAVTMQFPDYALLQQARPRRRLDEDTRFWVERLRGLDPRLELPVDRPRPTAPRFRGAFIREPLPRRLLAGLRDLAAAEDATPFAALLALDAVLLSLASGKSDVCIGIPSAHRTDRRALNAVGLFIGTLPFRCRIEPGATFRTLLAAVRTALFEALEHQDVSQETLVERLGLPRDPGRPPLFETMFVAETDPLAGVRVGGVTTERLELDAGSAKFDLTLFVNADADRPTLAIEYDTDLFDAATAQRLLSAYTTLLEQVVADPDRRVDDLAPIAPDERRTLLDEFGRGPAPTVGPADVVARILGAAKAAPRQPAVRFGGRTTTYGELIQVSRQLARRLVSAGAGPGTPVGLLLDRSPEMVVGVLGTLLAGAAYVPLDPTYPRQRLQYALDDLALASGDEPLVVLADGGPRGLGPGVRTIALGGETAGIEPGPALDRDGDGENLAYVIYTSGSTGRPKGVAVTRANLAASTAARIQIYDAAGRFLLVPSFAFDSSVAGLFWTLATGGTLVIPEPGESRDPRALARLIREAGVTDTLLLPSLWHFILKTHERGELDTLRRVVVAGEACSAEVVRAHAAALDAVELFNEYGPTETTVWATVHRCAPPHDADGGDDGVVPIGRPIPGARAYVLDRRGEPAPIGFAGELWIGGAGVARGYLHQAAATEERFVADPHDGGARRYRTGDRARFRRDGTIEFLGRTDDQIKLRGFRIEPGEVEALLATHPAVEEAGVAAVSAPGDGNGDRLVAYLRASVDDAVEDATLREYVRATLPEHMVPAAFVRVPDLPRLANGKLDRRRLAALKTPPAASSTVDAGPTDAIEDALAALWAEVLGVDTIAPSDDFFRLGGHSLSGVQLLLDVKERFNVELALAELFEAPRLRDMARRVRARSGALTGLRRESRVVAPVHTRGSLLPLFCVHAPAVEISATLGDDRPIYLVFESIGDSGAGPNGEMQSVRSIAAHYLQGIREVQPHGPYHLFGYSFGGMLAYEIALQLEAAGEAIGAVGLMDPTLAPVRMRAYLRLDELRRAKGVGGKARYLVEHGPGVLRRRVVAGNAPAAAPDPQQRIRAANVRRYVELGKKYDYPRSNLPCLVIVPEGHPGWLRFVRRYWSRRLGGAGRVDVVSGARGHMDLVHATHAADVIGRFDRFMREARARVVARAD